MLWNPAIRSTGVVNNARPGCEVWARWSPHRGDQRGRSPLSPHVLAGPSACPLKARRDLLVQLMLHCDWGMAPACGPQQHPSRSSNHTEQGSSPDMEAMDCQNLTVNFKTEACLACATTLAQVSQHNRIAQVYSTLLLEAACMPVPYMMRGIGRCVRQSCAWAHMTVPRSGRAVWCLQPSVYRVPSRPAISTRYRKFKP